MTYQDQLPGFFKQIPYVRNFRDLRLDFRDTIVSDFQIKNLLLFTKAVTIFTLLRLMVWNFVIEQQISNWKNLYKISKVQKWSEIFFFVWNIWRTRSDEQHVYILATNIYCPKYIVWTSSKCFKIKRKQTFNIIFIHR